MNSGNAGNAVCSSSLPGKEFATYAGKFSLSWELSFMLGLLLRICNLNRGGADLKIIACIMACWNACLYIKSLSFSTPGAGKCLPINPKGLLDIPYLVGRTRGVLRYWGSWPMLRLRRCPKWVAEICCLLCPTHCLLRIFCNTYSNNYLCYRLVVRPNSYL